MALLAAPLLVEAGHHVTSVIRNPDHSADVEATGAAAVVADVEHLDQAGIAEVIRGQDAVIWSAGAGGGDPDRTYAVDRDAAIRTMDAAVAEGVNRFVMISYAGAGRDDVPADNPFSHYAQAKAAADAHLRSTALVWTILGPGRLTMDDPTLHIDYGPHVAGGDTSRANVALVTSHVVSRADLGGATIDFRDGRVAIEEGIASIVRQVNDTRVAHMREGFDPPVEPPIPTDLTGG